MRDLDSLQEAELFTRKAIEINPFLANSYRSLALILYAQGNINLAVENIEKALSIDPNSKDNQLLKSILRNKKSRNIKIYLII